MAQQYLVQVLCYSPGPNVLNENTALFRLAQQYVVQLLRCFDWPKVLSATIVFFRLAQKYLMQLERSGGVGWAFVFVCV